MSGWLVAALAGAAAFLGAVVGAVWTRRAAAAAHAATSDELSRRLDELFALHELTYLLAESLDPARIAEHLAVYLDRFLHARGSLVALVREEGGPLTVAAASGTLADLHGVQLSEGDGGLLSAAVGRERMEIAEHDGGATPPILLGERSVERAAVVPLRAHGIPLGALAVADAPHPFPAAALRLLSTVATHAAAVLFNARFFELVQRARDEWQSTFDALGGALAVVDDRGRIRRANRALAVLLDRPVEALIGLELGAVVCGDGDPLGEFLREVRERGVTAGRVVEARPLDRLLRVSAAPMHRTGPGAWVVALIEDITEQKLLEQQLIQNEKMAAVGQLVSGVAHELNNPLTSIAGLAEFLLERSAPGNPAREHLRVMREQADRAGRIVQNLLAFARRGPAEMGDVDLNEVIKRTVSLVRHELQLREIALETTLDPSLPTLRGDRHQLQQVVLNLVTNALHAVGDNPPERTRAIRLTTTAEGEYVSLRVADTGPGIPAEAVSQVFTPFFTTKRPGEGTGLGLAIAYRIAQGHGGQLLVKNDPGGGAAFVLRLPRSDSPASRRAPDALTPAPPEQTPVAGVARILLVDADPAVRKMLAVLLDSEHHHVQAAEDAARAAELLGRETFDLVLADPRAAVSAGERFADYLVRCHPDLRDRTIFLTADVRPETDAWLRDLGGRYFFKPFRVGELKAAVAELLAARKG